MLLQQQRDLDGVVVRVAALDQLVDHEADADAERGAHRSSDRIDDLDEDAGAVGDAAAVAVGAHVGPRRQEPLQEVVVVGVQLDAVDARLVDLAGREHELVDQPLQLRRLDDVWHLVAQVAALAGRRPEGRASLEEELDRRVGAVGMEQVGVLDGALVEDGPPEHAFGHRAQAGRVEAGRDVVADVAGDAVHPAETGLHPRLPVAEVALGLLGRAEQVVDGRGVGRCHQPVRQPEPARVERPEDHREPLAHLGWCSHPTPRSAILTTAPRAQTRRPRSRPGPGSCRDGLRTIGHRDGPDVGPARQPRLARRHPCRRGRGRGRRSGPGVAGRDVGPGPAPRGGAHRQGARPRGGYGGRARVVAHAGRARRRCRRHRRDRPPAAVPPRPRSRRSGDRRALARPRLRRFGRACRRHHRHPAPGAGGRADGAPRRPGPLRRGSG